MSDHLERSDGVIAGGQDFSRSDSGRSLRKILHSGMAVLRARWYLRRATSVGEYVQVFGRPYVENSRGTMIIGDRVRVVSTVATSELAVAVGILEIGAGSFINYGCSLGATLRVSIGRNCRIGPHCNLIDNDFHRLEPERRDERPESAPIILGDNVWLATRVIVLRGVTIGEGSVIGAGSVVTKDIPPRSLAMGMPAKVVRAL